MRRLIAVGGISVIVAVLLIFFYLLWVVFPLFLPATTELGKAVTVDDWRDSKPVYLSVEEQLEVGMRLDASGTVEFFAAGSGAPIEKTQLPLGGDSGVVRATESLEDHGLDAVATTGGSVLLFRHSYKTEYDGGVETKKIKPLLEYPYGKDAVLTAASPDISALAVSDGPQSLVVAVASAGGQVKVNFASKTENFLSGDVSLEPDIKEAATGFDVSAAAVSGDHKWLYLGDREGQVHRYGLPDLEPLQTVDVADSPITSMNMLLGGISLLVGDADGVITQLFPVRGDNNVFHLQLIRRFEGLGSPVRKILPEHRRKGFMALGADGEIGIYHSTAGRLVHKESLAGLEPEGLALAPRSNALLIEGSGGRLDMLRISNAHPEVSFSSLFRKVWYENYPEPEYVWQSSAATNEFEPKFSLTPLIFGTIKAALYAMLFAIPLALMGAAYTAYFMSPELRKWVKPGIEIMAALPTVILGFLAGLWFAPWVEENLADLLLMLLLIPPGLFLFAWLWYRYDNPVKRFLPEGWEPILLLPVLTLLAVLAMLLSDPLQILVFGGDLRHWLTHEAGISYDQRNALVVGCAMGFAVIPTIFSIAEDAVYGVPGSLSNGSLALGATPWQTLVYVVLPTASPGIFSGLMIGLGRAVGETMIVLMATGNTPLMDWNLFEGMRTLAANIAVEMPESEVNSTHYRILFLAALVLFLFTFVVNTGAEIIRQRLREKYSSL
ncbi:MAG: ABC transporter permease subunit [Lysobacterales bacterium]